MNCEVTRGDAVDAERVVKLERVIVDAAVAMALLPRVNGKPDGKVGLFQLKIMDRAVTDLLELREKLGISNTEN